MSAQIDIKKALFTGAVAGAGMMALRGVPAQGAAMMGAVAAAADAAMQYLGNTYSSQDPTQAYLKYALGGAAIEGAWMAAGMVPGFDVMDFGLAVGSCYAGGMLAKQA